MKRLTYLLMVFMLVLGAMPFAAPAAPAVAQADVVAARLAEYNSNLPKGYGVISVEELNTMLAEKPVVLLDVRQPEEYEAGHLKDSFNVPIRDLTKNLNLLPDLNANIVVICKGGFRAIMAMSVLNVLGYKNARTLKGGYDAWVGEELPTIKEPVKAVAGKAPEVNAEVLAKTTDFLSNLPKGYGAVAPKDLAAELVDAPPILIDVRAKDEWDKGYIKGAKHIWINEFMSRQSDWPADKNAKIVVYCASSYRGGIAMMMLSMLGYKNVRNLSGGSNAWVAAGLPLEGAQPQAAASEFNLDTYLADTLKAMPDTFNAVRVADLEKELAAATKPFLVDVRTADEFAEGFIEGAINIPLSELTKHLDLLPDLNENIVVYCGSGHRSAMAMTALNVLGYTKVRSLLGGTTAWAASKLPLSQKPVERKPGKAPAFKPAVFELVDAFMTAIPKSYYTVKPADLSVELIEKKPVVIDVRTDAEWQAGHVKGAVHITLRDFLARQKEWPTDKNAAIVVYDNPTHRSSIALVLLSLKGYKNVRVMAGGTAAWEKANLPLEK